MITSCRSTSSTDQVPVAAPRSIEGDPIGDAYNLLTQRSVGQVDDTKIAAAGVQGLRLALMTNGVVPPEVPTPNFTGDQAQDLDLLHSAVQLTTNHYGSKLNVADADDAVIASMAQSLDDCHTAYFPPQQFKQ